MEARFAGSQRAGDRRRRRLAVGVDDYADTANPDDPGRSRELSAPAGSFRCVDSAHIDRLETAPSTPLHLSLANVVPAEGWKYLVGGLLGLAFGAVVTITGCFAPELQTLAGPGISGLFALPNGRVAQWFSSFLLLLCAQLALLIWWTRSRSLEDFEGRYWLWIRTACIWIVFSGCVSIEAHSVALKTLLHIRPELSREWSNLCWMIPVATLGALLVKALVREMRGCRASRALLLLAFACQLSAAGLHLALEAVCSPSLRAILVQVGLLIGHVALFISMWLHARHVLHCTADPAPIPPRTWRMPRPHFRLAHFRLSPWRFMQVRLNRGRAPEPQAPLEGTKSRRKRQVREAAAETVAQAVSEPIDKNPASQAEHPSKPRIRFDSRHPGPLQNAAPAGGAPAQADGEGGEESGNDGSPFATGTRNTGPTESEGPAGRIVAEIAICTDGSTDSEVASEEGLSKPELRGLSKKQRRRLMQELRDRERESKR